MPPPPLGGGDPIGMELVSGPIEPLEVVLGSLGSMLVWQAPSASSAVAVITVTSVFIVALRIGPTNEVPRRPGSSRCATRPAQAVVVILGARLPFSIGL